MALYQAPINSFYDSWNKGPVRGQRPSLIGGWLSAPEFGPVWPSAESATPAPSAGLVAGPFGSLRTPSTPALSAPPYGSANQSDNPFSTLMNVKSPEIDAATGKLLTDYGKFSDSPDRQTYLDRLRESEGTALSNYERENPVVNDTYTGKLASDLQGLSDRRYNAERAAADYAIKEALMPAKSAQIEQGGGRGSYSDRIAIGALAPIELKLASDRAAREELNFGNVRANQLQLLGAANARLDQFNNRTLMPLQFQQNQLAAQLGLLSPISQLQQSNRFYGVQSPLTGASPGYGVPSYGGGGFSPMPYVPQYNPFSAAALRAAPSVPTRMPVQTPVYAGANNISQAGWNSLFEPEEPTQFYSPTAGIYGMRGGVDYGQPNYAPSVAPSAPIDYFDESVYGG